MTSLFPLLVESLFMSSSLAVILIDWNHSFLDRSLLRLILSYLPRWRYRNIRQDVYICLFGVALAIMYNNSMKNFAINMENCRIIGASIVILLSFWLQSKANKVHVSDKCIGTSKIQVSDKSVQGESLVTRDQEVNVSTCCGAGVPQLLLPLSFSSKPPPEIDIRKEMGESYVEACKSQYDEEELVTALKYLNKLKGGYPPSPAEFTDFYDEQKGIEDLKNEVKERDQALESVQKKTMSLQQMVQQHQQAIQQKNQALQQKDQALQQKDRMLDYKDRLLLQMRERIRELEQGELQKRTCEMERENQYLYQRLMCKICRVKEVQVLLSPCNHLVCCQNCVPSLPQERCPICAGIIQDTIEMFFA
ncbi:uncharacterized protein LOC128166025 [Crassostrea angulata]|uniref:uncharacterized protein LOC128166025 n=1 Tax=Magallana angulata TaxID=2784310 RepID=UPI0022B08C12|nr:uncharacterized protein LOC128166025 [Crassostrea angulata]